MKAKRAWSDCGPIAIGTGIPFPTDGAAAVGLNGGVLISYWSTLQSNIARSSVRVGLSVAAKHIAHNAGVLELFTKRSTAPSIAAGFVWTRVCAKELPEHLSTRQIWAQGTVQVYGVVLRIVRFGNTSSAINTSTRASRRCT